MKNCISVIKGDKSLYQSIYAQSTEKMFNFFLLSFFPASTLLPKPLF